MKPDNRFTYPVTPTFFVTVLIGLFIFLQSCSGSKSIVSSRVDQPLTVDGDLSDWPHTEALLKESNYFDYYATHDTSNLYLYVNLKNVQYKQIVENAGLTIYLSSNKKNKRALGITYPVGAFNFLREMPGTFQQFKQNADWIKKPENQKLLDELKQDNYKQVMITQKPSKDQPPQQDIVDLARLEAQGVQIAREQLHGRLQVELKIPLNSSKTQQFAVEVGKNDKLHVGFTVEPPNTNRNDASTTVDLSQRSIYSGAYGRHRDNQQMDQRLSQLTSSQDTWFTLQLSPSVKN